MKSDYSNLILNIGGGNATSILDLANMVINTSGLKMNPIFVEALEGDIEKSLADISQAKKYLDWEPKIIGGFRSPILSKNLVITPA